MLGIAPFNFPLNLCAHKVAPAIAVGAPIILKPAPATPLSGLILGELLAETELPAGSWSVLPVANDKMPALVQDERLPVISFTGSDKVGYAIMDSVPRKHCTLELGGNGAAVVLARLRLGAGPGLGGDPHRHLLQLPGRPVLHLRAARHRGRRRVRPAAPEDRRRRRGAGHRRPVRRRHRRRPAGQRGRRQARRVLGRRGRTGRCQAAHRRQARRRRLRAHRARRACPPTPPSPARRSSDRS